MFEAMIAGSVEPELLKILRLAQTGLGEVRQKQVLLANSGDHMTALVAQQVLLQLDAWDAGLGVMIGGLVPKAAPAPHANPVPGGHR
jgi:hypothetical protein